MSREWEIDEGSLDVRSTIRVIEVSRERGGIPTVTRTAPIIWAIEVFWELRMIEVSRERTERLGPRAEQIC